LGRIISVTNQKGGVGKTTTAINLAASLAVNDIPVLLIDADPQGNSTTGLGIQKSQDTPTLYNVLMDETDVNSAIVKTEIEGLDLLPSDKNLVGANIALVPKPEREYNLRKKLASIRDRYHYVLIDCPPALDLLTLNALLASDSVLIPIQCEFFALEGISELLDTIDRIRDSFHHKIALEGILLTMYDDRTNLTRQVAADPKKYPARRGS
jgi:chromosome partitioning protein